MQEGKYQELEERTYEFARKVREYVRKLQRSISNIEYGKQLIRSSGSVAANYIEANEALSEKDFFHRIKICRKEAKESRLWLRLAVPFPNQESERAVLIQESEELKRIFSSIVLRKSNKEKNESGETPV